MSTTTTTLSPATVAAFKRAMVPGTAIRIQNILRPEASRDSEVLPRTNTVDLVTAAEAAGPRGSCLSWPKRGTVLHDGDRRWGLLDDAGGVRLEITVLGAACLHNGYHQPGECPEAGR